MAKPQGYRQTSSENLISTKIIHFIFYIMVAFIPHIYRYMEVLPTKSEEIYFGTSIYADLYTYAKSKAFLILTVFLILFFVYQIVIKNINFIFDKINIGAFIFASIIIISDLMSPYQDLVYWGAKDRYEGMWVWLSYVAVFIIARHYVNNAKFKNKLIKVFIFSSTIMGVIGVAQIVDYDIYTQGFFKYLAFPYNIAINIKEYLLSRTTYELAVGALYNSNYYGVYMAISALLSLNYALKKNKLRLLYLFTFLISYAALLSSKAEGGLFCLFTAIAILLIYKFEYILKYKLYFVIIFISTILVDRLMIKKVFIYYEHSSNAKYIYIYGIVACIFSFLTYIILKRNDSIKKILRKYSLYISFALVVILFLILNYSVFYLGKSEANIDLKEIEFKKNRIMFDYDNTNPIYFEFLNSSEVRVVNKDEEIILNTKNDKDFKFNIDEKEYLGKIQVYSDGNMLSILSPFNINVFYDGKNLSYINPYTGISTIEKPNHIERYYNNGGAITSRAYIWSGFLSQFHKNILFGNGLDTYVFIFPQNDYIGKTRYLYAGDNIIVDKPHSMYIGVLLSMGSFGILLFLVFVVFTISECIKSIVLVFLNLNEFKEQDFIVLYIVSILIFISSIINDSTIAITILLSVFSALSLDIVKENEK